MKTATKEQQVAHQEYVREERKQSSQTMKLQVCDRRHRSIVCRACRTGGAGTCKVRRNSATAPLGNTMAASATSAANKGFIIGEGAVVSKGDNHETYGNGLGHVVHALRHLRFCSHSSSRVERPGPYHA
jgi:hypothetical protein